MDAVGLAVRAAGLAVRGRMRVRGALVAQFPVPLSVLRSWRLAGTAAAGRGAAGEASTRQRPSHPHNRGPSGRRGGTGGRSGTRRRGQASQPCPARPHRRSPAKGPEHEGPPAQKTYHVEDLAHETRTTVRTIRANQDRGLLPRPERQGRANLCSEAHVTRLHQIAHLLDRGYTLASIKELRTPGTPAAPGRRPRSGHRGGEAVDGRAPRPSHPRRTGRPLRRHLTTTP